MYIFMHFTVAHDNHTPYLIIVGFIEIFLIRFLLIVCLGPLPGTRMTFITMATKDNRIRSMIVL